MKNKERRKFKGVWIPKDIWLSKKLTPREKFFLVEIDSLDNNARGCYANNRHFSELFHVTGKTSSRIIQTLIEKGLVISKIDRSSGNKRSLTVIPGILEPYPHKCPEGVSPKMSIGSGQKCPEGMDKKGDTPIPQNVQHTIPIPIPNNQMTNTNDNGIGKKLSVKEMELVLENDIKIGQARNDLIDKLHRILRPVELPNHKEKTTISRVVRNIVRLAQNDPENFRFFEEAVRWAEDAANGKARGGIRNANAVFVAKAKRETGFKKQEKIL